MYVYMYTRIWCIFLSSQTKRVIRKKNQRQARVECKFNLKVNGNEGSSSSRVIFRPKNDINCNRVS